MSVSPPDGAGTGGAILGDSLVIQNSYFENCTGKCLFVSTFWPIGIEQSMSDNVRVLSLCHSLPDFASDRL